MRPPRRPSATAAGFFEERSFGEGEESPFFETLACWPLLERFGMAIQIIAQVVVSKYRNHHGEDLVNVRPEEDLQTTVITVMIDPGHFLEKPLNGDPIQTGQKEFARRP